MNVGIERLRKLIREQLQLEKQDLSKTVNMKSPIKDMSKTVNEPSPKIEKTVSVENPNGGSTEWHMGVNNETGLVVLKVGGSSILLKGKDASSVGKTLAALGQYAAMKEK